MSVDIRQNLSQHLLRDLEVKLPDWRQRNVLVDWNYPTLVKKAAVVQLKVKVHLCHSEEQLHQRG